MRRGQKVLFRGSDSRPVDAWAGGATLVGDSSIGISNRRKSLLTSRGGTSRFWDFGIAKGTVFKPHGGLVGGGIVFPSGKTADLDRRNTE